ncbi:MAG TPA: Gfo/Idh/MocA family oxidoreductase [Candidatus Hydrogenedens sp.]|nr:Gfo/Idh/MocA family oxidoreductase [Candidatus Hydrogenedens sp.]HOK09856.1 Gfo/Idh/MocA family oxidoreductase [Candidatus Hydrogenedens sp.]HOL19528.1 Gfo/Idh/MocA family oxidoreductase [Candidatus Hydrogenedens sp.]HPP59368.1 Gfo/Idh/MocA family oxidoreductase [Candidatus Hydrogenedens sp.]
MNRRTFLKCTLSAPLIIKSSVLGAQGTPPPSEQVTIGVIGLGGRSNELIKTLFQIPTARIISACDCFQPRLDSAMKAVGEKNGWHAYTHPIEMLDKEKLDAVIVPTTTHSRAWICAHALIRGIDTYIEKPMALTVEEGRALVKLARKHKRVTQVGTQQRSIPLNNWASDLVKNGAIGKVKKVISANFVSPLRWDENTQYPDSPYTNQPWWDLWTNQAVFRPYHEQIHRGWAKWWDYDGGGVSFGVTGWGAHAYDQIQRGLGTDLTGPVEVILEEQVENKPAGLFEQREIKPEETGAPYYPMTKDIQGPRAKVRMRYENGVELELYYDSDRGPGLGCIFVGENGSIEINRDAVSSDPPEILQRPDRPEKLSVPETQPHLEEFVQCVKTRKMCNTDVEIGHRSNTICILVNIVRDLGKVGEVLKWNPEKEKFINCKEGNAMLSRPRRKGYELPT